MMDLINLKVAHKVFGQAIIIDCENSYITVEFSQGEKKFKYPMAFDEHLEMKDIATAEIMKQEIEKIKEADAQEKKRQKESAKAKIKQIVNEELKGKKKRKFAPRMNIAFKCNFCDGGNSKEQVGFMGVCSDAIIHNNIDIEKRTWCSSKDCVCRQYLNKQISRIDLESIYENVGFVCYESQMFINWKASAGVVQTGKKKGQPMKLIQVQSNSLCVLTTRDPNSVEAERYIFGVFLVDETYEGDNREEGYVSTKSKYRIKLSPSQAHKMLFWNYHINGNSPESMVWSSGLHRYIESVEAIQILQDSALLKRGTNDEALTNEFLDYYARINNIDITLLPKKNGALLRV